MLLMLGQTNKATLKQKRIRFLYLCENLVFKDISCFRSISEPLEQLIVKLLQVR